MKKDQNYASKKKELLLALVMLFLLLVVIGGVILFVLGDKGSPEDPTGVTEAAQMPYDVPGFTMLAQIPAASFDNGLQVLCGGRYSGAYLEDGTDEQITDVLALVIYNSGDTLMEYGVVELAVNGQTGRFEFSGLPAGAAVLVQENSRLLFTKDMTFSAPVCTQAAYPSSIVLDFGGDFELYPGDGVLNVKNISGTDFSGDVSVFYKHFEYGLFMGGITYRARISGGIQNGTIAQTMQKHYRVGTSAILYMSYGN